MSWENEDDSSTDSDDDEVANICLMANEEKEFLEASLSKEKGAGASGYLGVLWVQARVEIYQVTGVGEEENGLSTRVRESGGDFRWSLTLAPGQKQTLRHKRRLRNAGPLIEQSSYGNPLNYIKRWGMKYSPQGKCVPESDLGLVLDRSGWLE
ncbi:hypothetical protein PIB30_081144 [Stylosanthes scabra]|uniref:Uncharacterized protein n=1 Tax=Stylosanthes scabra TaxID=79078 RepID=A0ABU6SRS2_9FABA|nr:hypothetical protein [Stylosanthes scabra]